MIVKPCVFLSYILISSLCLVWEYYINTPDDSQALCKDICEFNPQRFERKGRIDFVNFFHFHFNFFSKVFITSTSMFFNINLVLHCFMLTQLCLNVFFNVSLNLTMISTGTTNEEIMLAHWHIPASVNFSTTLVNQFIK